MTHEARFGLWSLAALTLLFGASCFSYDDDPVEDTGEDTAIEDAEADEGSDVALVEGVASYTPYVPPATAEAAAMERTFSPLGCEHTVEHPNGITNAMLDFAEGTDSPLAIRVNFPTEDPSSTVAVVWQTDNDTRLSQLRLGDTEDELDLLYGGHSFNYQALDENYLHEVHVCGLLPGRTYYYQVGGDGAWSATHTFTTAPVVDSTEEFTFAVAGDTRTDDLLYQEWNQALRQIHEAGVDFITHSGDLVDIGLDVQQWLPFFAASDPYLGDLPLLPVVGNHDFFDINYIANFALPHTEEHWHVRYGNALIISLNDYSITDYFDNLTESREYLEQTLIENSDVEWRILIHHRPLFSAGTRHGPADELQEEWGDLLDQYNVDIVFSGHEHNYERSRPIAFPAGQDPTTASGDDGTVFIVAAGLGAPLYDIGSNWWTITSESVENYMIVNVSGTTMSATAYRLDGTVLDEFELQH